MDLSVLLNNPVVFIPIITVALAVIGFAVTMGKMIGKIEHIDKCLHRIEEQVHGRISHLEDRVIRIEDKLDRLIDSLRNSKTNA